MEYIGYIEGRWCCINSRYLVTYICMDAKYVYDLSNTSE